MQTELLAPAGNLEKLKMAIMYGADAVYLGGQKFGLRAASENFIQSELEEGVKFAHEYNRKAYVVLNGYLHDKDLEELPEYLKVLEKNRVDAVIVSDLGVINSVLSNCSIPIHLSTQASCLNSGAARFWRDSGVKRIVLGRETSLSEAKKIKDSCGLEIEMFIHGSMCMAYSGNCVISNFTQGRDSNRGGCAHSCRFAYTLDYKNSNKSSQTTFMSSKDLKGLHLLEEFVKAGVDSLKVEGRMKGPHYVGTISKVYSEALKSLKNSPEAYQCYLPEGELELSKLTHRSYTEASLESPAGADSIYDEKSAENSSFHVAGVVVEELKATEALEWLPFAGPSQTLNDFQIEDLTGKKIEITHPGMVVRVKGSFRPQKGNILRSQLEGNL